MGQVPQITGVCSYAYSIYRITVRFQCPTNLIFLHNCATVPHQANEESKDILAGMIILVRKSSRGESLK